MQEELWGTDSTWRMGLKGGNLMAPWQKELGNSINMNK